jgi:hypothetical protein
VVLVVLGLAAGVLSFILLFSVGALGLLLTGPSIALLATGFAIARNAAQGLKREEEVEAVFRHGADAG